MTKSIVTQKVIILGPIWAPLGAPITPFKKANRGGGMWPKACKFDKSSLCPRYLHVFITLRTVPSSTSHAAKRYTQKSLEPQTKLQLYLVRGPFKGPIGPHIGGGGLPPPHTPWHGTPGGQIGPKLLGYIWPSREMTYIWVSREMT